MRYSIIILFCVSLYGGGSTDDINITENITALKGDSYKIKCISDLPIVYCWLSAPNGTYFSLSKNNKECSLEIESSSLSDNGVWKCNMGNYNTVDNITNIAVNIYDTPLVAREKVILFRKSINITCETIDSSPLEYCRFVRPDNRGIFPMLNSIYSNTSIDLKRGRCTVILENPSLLDIGNWTCFAKSTSDAVEYFDTILVHNNRASPNLATNILFWILYILCITSIIVVSMLILFRIRIDSATSIQARPVISDSTSI